jgi:hypothetical protein
LRGETFLTDIWTVSDRRSLTFETSRITQTGDAAKQREFSYPKRQFTASWKAGPGSDVRTSLKRGIAQLDFAEFASSFNSIDATTIIGIPISGRRRPGRPSLNGIAAPAPRGAFTLHAFSPQMPFDQVAIRASLSDFRRTLPASSRSGSSTYSNVLGIL